jgi:hypothetical protein
MVSLILLSEMLEHYLIHSTTFIIHYSLIIHSTRLGLSYSERPEINQE